jgi:hypothetical protein
MPHPCRPPPPHQPIIRLVLPHRIVSRPILINVLHPPKRRRHPDIRMHTTRAKAESGELRDDRPGSTLVREELAVLV